MNKYIKPFLYAALFFALTHILVLVFLIITTGNISYLNIFYIWGLTELFPEIDKGLLSNFLSVLIILAVYLFFYFKQKK